MMTPFEDFVYLINHVLLGEEPTIEDFILLVGTLVAFIAFILWCCFPIQPKEPGQHRQFTCKIITTRIKTFDAAAAAAANNKNNTDKGIAATATKTGSSILNGSGSGSSSSGGSGGSGGGASSSSISGLGINNSALYNGANGSYSKNGTVAMHNYYVKNGHHCCT